MPECSHQECSQGAECSQKAKCSQGVGGQQGAEGSQTAGRRRGAQCSEQLSAITEHRVVTKVRVGRKRGSRAAERSYGSGIVKEQGVLRL